MAEIIAKLNQVPMSPYKVRVVASAVKDLSLEEALAALQHSQKKAARPLYKLLNSAVANAENNHELKRGQLSIKELQVGDGLRLKRIRPRARGRADRIIKRTSNIRVVLEGE